MKYILLLLTLIVALTIGTSCTEQDRVRTFGGAMEIRLPKGQKLMMATWKETNLFYLTEPMDSTYVPKEKIFQESSSFGALESRIHFIESK